MLNGKKFNKDIIELIRKNLEERHDLELSNFSQYQLVEMWIDKTLNEKIHFN
jgi:hypothetical protein